MAFDGDIHMLPGAAKTSETCGHYKLTCALLTVNKKNTWFLPDKGNKFTQFSGPHPGFFFRQRNCILSPSWYLQSMPVLQGETLQWQVCAGRKDHHDEHANVAGLGRSLGFRSTPRRSAGVRGNRGSAGGSGHEAARGVTHG